MTRWLERWVVVLAGLTCGCSFTFTETRPAGHEKLAYFDCTSTAGLPVADGFMALSSALATQMTLSKSKQEYADQNDGADRDLVAGITLAQAGVFAASGVFGLIHTQRCHQAKRALRARLARSETAPRVVRTRTPIRSSKPLPPRAAPETPRTDGPALQQDPAHTLPDAPAETGDPPTETFEPLSAPRLPETPRAPEPTPVAPGSGGR